MMNVGHIILEGINIAAEGLYNGIDETFVEYGWLVHLAMLPLSGQVTIPQVSQYILTGFFESSLDSFRHLH